MKELAQWAGFRFYIDAGSALLFEKLKISAEMETEEQEDQGQKYVSSKSGKPVEVSLNAILNAKLGIDVQTVCMDFLEAAKTGQSGAFFMNGKRLLPFEIMLTKASTEEIQIAPGGVWVSANVSVTFRQSQNGTILGGVIQKAQETTDFTYSAPPKPVIPLGGGLLSIAAETNPSIRPVQEIDKIKSDAKAAPSGVTPAPAAASSGSGKTVKVSSAVLKIVKK